MLPLCSIQHKENQALPHSVCHPASGTGHGYLSPRLLQRAPSRSSSLCCETLTNGSARLVFDQPKRTHVTPLLSDLHWLPVASRIKFKSLMLAYRVTTGSAPIYLNSIIQTYVPSCPLCSSNERRLALPALHTKHSQSLF